LSECPSTTPAPPAKIRNADGFPHGESVANPFARPASRLRPRSPEFAISCSLHFETLRLHTARSRQLNFQRLGPHLIKPALLLVHHVHPKTVFAGNVNGWDDDGQIDAFSGTNQCVEQSGPPMGDRLVLF